MGANAARPAPFRRGTLEMPLPVPRDSAVVFLPAIGSRPWGWMRLDWIARTARLITSGLTGCFKDRWKSYFSSGFAL